MARMTIRCELGDTSRSRGRVRDVPHWEKYRELKTPTRSTPTLDKSKTKFLYLLFIGIVGAHVLILILSCDVYSKRTN